MKNRIIILGSTGSIGRSALDVLTTLRDEFEVVGLAAGSRWSELAEQAAVWRPSFVGIGHAHHEAALRDALPAGTNVVSGAGGLADMVEATDCDCVVSAIIGVAGLEATVRAVALGKKVALANKEAMVVAGPLLTTLARQTGAAIIPIDSEHSGVFQALQSGRPDEVARIFLTSSGGPFRTWPSERIAAASVAEALNHPVWAMGPKITIDSATMMNKALEVIEARWLFDLPADRIEVLVHPEAVVHALVEYCDGSVIAQLGLPDMRGPIQYALTYPRRTPTTAARLNMSEIRQLTFEPPDEARFPAVRLGFEVAARGGSAGAVFNAANEEAVTAFRNELIKLGDITSVTRDALDRHDWVAAPGWDELLEADAWARNEVRQCLKC